jgi:hypothetical protein
MQDIYVICIINKKYVRWEIFDTTHTMEDLYNLLENKYNTGKIIIEIEDIFFQKFLQDKLEDFAVDDSITARITTKNQLYTLEKCIN